MPSIFSALPLAISGIKNKSRSESALTPTSAPAILSTSNVVNAFPTQTRHYAAAAGPGPSSELSPTSPTTHPNFTQAFISPSSTTISTYQRSLNVLKQLNSIPEAAIMIQWPDIDPRKSWQIDLTDPMRILLETFRLGEPLCAFYNALKPRQRLEMPGEPSGSPSGFQSLISASTGSLFSVGDDSDVGRRKKATTMFLKACKQDLQIPESALFQLADLFKDEPTERQKCRILSTLEMVLHRIKQMELFPNELRSLPIFIPDLNPSVEAGRGPDPMDETEQKRLKLLKEMLDTERKYVADLDLLLEYYNSLKASRLCSFTELSTMFPNLEELVEYQHRFLSKMEASVASSYERVGLLFTKMEPSLAAIYTPMCVGLEAANKMLMTKSSQLAAISLIEPRYELPSYLIKPVQRVCRYPLLLQQLLKLTNRGSYPYYGELVLGVEAAKRVAELVNQKRRESENTPSVQELQRRVVDWRGLQPFEFGTLQLYDTFMMSSLTGAERSFTIYLFDHILLCCQAVPLALASKSARMLGLTEKEIPQDQTMRGTIAIKGHVYMDCVTAVHDVHSKPPDKPVLKVFWRNSGNQQSASAVTDEDIDRSDNFELRCKDAEQCRIWKERIERIVVEERKRKDALEKQKKLRQSPEDGVEAGQFEAPATNLAEIQQGSPSTPNNAHDTNWTSLGGDWLDGSLRRKSNATWKLPEPTQEPQPPVPKSINNRNPFKPGFVPQSLPPLPPVSPITSHWKSEHNGVETHDYLQDAVSILQSATTTELKSKFAAAAASSSSPESATTPEISNRTSLILGDKDSFESRTHRLSISSTRSVQPGLKVKIHFQSEIFLLQLSVRDPTDVPIFSELRSSVLSKVGIPSTDDRSKTAKIKYKDEEGDLVNLEADEDVALVIESAFTEWAEKAESPGRKGSKSGPTLALYVMV